MWPKATLRMFTQAKSSFRILLDAIITHLLINHYFEKWYVLLKALYQSKMNLNLTELNNTKITAQVQNT